MPIFIECLSYENTILNILHALYHAYKDGLSWNYHDPHFFQIKNPSLFLVGFQPATA